jgi:ABC-type antimicrobial peptide transport system permease subunit
MLILMTIFAMVALALTAVGIYGVLSFSVSQRRQEIGIRMALGARANSVLGLVVREGMVLTALGVLMGIGGGLAGSRFIESLLFGVAPGDPLTFGLSSVLLLLTALAACYLPARRAATVNPVEVLKND